MSSLRETALIRLGAQKRRSDPGAGAKLLSSSAEIEDRRSAPDQARWSERRAKAGP